MIKFLDLKKVNAVYEPELSQRVQRVINSGWYLLADEQRSFEAEYAEFIGVESCVGVGNGLDALRLILKAYLEMGEMRVGDEILVPANTFIASILAITENGLIPVFIEPDLLTYNMDYLDVEKKISPKTKAIMVVHLYGQCALNTALIDLAKRYDLKIIEDNAQAAGATRGNQRTGSLGDAAGHSFYPGKNLGALGDAGAVTTDNEDLAAVIRALANYGSTQKYQFEYQGVNSRIDEIQAAVLRLKLTHLDSENERRRSIANLYLEYIDQANVTLPLSPDNPGSHVWHIFNIRAPQRDRLQQYLTEQGIETGIHYPIPPHKQNAYSSLRIGELPNTERCQRENLSLPISPVLTQDEAWQVIEAVNGFCE